MVGTKDIVLHASVNLISDPTLVVRLGNSGLKISRIILGSLSRIRANLCLVEMLTGGIRL